MAAVNAAERYRLVRTVASGGMAQVMEAVAFGHGGFERRVAIKRLLPQHARDGERRRMFFEEARLGSRMHHGGIVPIFDYGLIDGSEFMAMEYVDGLDALRAVSGPTPDIAPMPEGIALHVTAEIAHALAYIHDLRDDENRALAIVHRDVSPPNILLSWNGDVKLSDFGIALSRAGAPGSEALGGVQGKLHYMAPEQARGEPVSAAADLYALGATLDALLGGGIERGTSTLFVGAPGTGKSSVAMQFAIAAADRGEHAAAFIFDESINTLRTRCSGMGMNLKPHVESGHITLRQVDPAELSPGELVHEVRHAVLQKKATVVIIDSLNGYLNAMPNEQFLIVQLHELLTFLGQAGVATLLIGAHHGLIGAQMQTPVDASYLADAVVLLRYFEADGMVRQAISVMKKRGGAHERSIRDFTLSETGIHVGPPLRQFRGILTGVPIALDERDSRKP